MEALVIALLTWIDDNADYSLDDFPPPLVRELSAEALTAELRGEPHDSVMPGEADSRVHALYSWQDGPHGTIFILEAASTPGLQLGEPPLENPVFRERLLHELVHHVQFHTGAYADFDCVEMGEVDALRLGGLYLERHRADDPLPQRRMLMHEAARCDTPTDEGQGASNRARSLARISDDASRLVPTTRVDHKGD